MLLQPFGDNELMIVWNLKNELIIMRRVCFFCGRQICSCSYSGYVYSGYVYSGYDTVKKLCIASLGLILYRIIFNFNLVCVNVDTNKE